MEPRRTHPGPRFSRQVSLHHRRENGRKDPTHPGHAHAGHPRVAWSPDGRTLALGSARQVSLHHRRENGRKDPTHPGHAHILHLQRRVEPRRTHPGPRFSRQVSLHHRRENGERIQHIQGMHTGWIWSVAWSPDGRTLALGSGDRSASIIDAKTGERIQHIQGMHTGYI